MLYAQGTICVIRHERETEQKKIAKRDTDTVWYSSRTQRH